LKPIIFSTSMVQAILRGRKTQTRRVVKMSHRKGCPWAFDENDNTGYEWIEADPDFSAHDYRQPCRCIQCPYGKLGDELWVRETFVLVPFPCAHLSNGTVRAIYKADENECFDWKWKPSIHMPRWAARLFLKITDIQVERVQDISEEDSKAEGVVPFPYDAEGDCWTDGTYRSAFEYLWGEINGWKGEPKARAPWADNPWVWVLGFEKI